MANKRQEKRLKQGVKNWNKWRERNKSIEIDLSKASLKRIDLCGVNLSRSELSGADLSEANLIETNLIEANLSGVNLQESNLRRAFLGRANIREANIRKANLSSAILNEANFIQANLSEANLIQAQALGTNLNAATLTGACLKDWNINGATNLNKIVYKYVYFKAGKNERRPADPNKNFEPGDFCNLVQKVLNTVDLIFSDGIDWQAFLASFQKLQVESDNGDLAIQAIERKTGKAFVVRVEVPPDADKAELEKSLQQEYAIKLKAIEDKYRLELNAKDREIKLYKERNADMNEIATLLASKTINVEVKSVASSESKGDSIKFENSTLGIGVSKGEVKAEKLAGTINEAQSKSITEAAAEIEQLLARLSNIYPTTTSGD